MTLTYLLFSLAPLAVAPPLTFPLLPPVLPYHAHWRCFRTQVLIIYQFFYLSLSLQSFAPTSVPLPSIFRKLVGMTLPPTWTPTVLLQRNTCLFPLLLLFSGTKCHQIFHSFRPHQNALLKPGGLLKWKMRLLKDARLSLQLTEVMKIARLTSRLLDALRLSSPRLTHGRRLALLSRPNLTLNLYTLFFTISLAPLLTSPTVFLPESASVFAAYLRSHFAVCQPKALHSRARGYLSELHRATCPEESHLSFCSPFSPAELFSAASNLSSSTATGTDKVAYPMLKHLPRSGMDFLLHIFNLSWTLHSFPSIWKTSSIIPIHKMGKPLNSPDSFQPISLTSCVSKLFERIILSRLLFSLES